MAEPGAIRTAGASVKKIGRYRIIDRLGKGAMGIVYRAHDDQMDREVALKVMMADLEAEPDTRARFYREAKVTSQLLHRNIVTIFDLGEDDGRLYIVMELLRGETLSEFLKRPKAQSLEQKLDLMMQICEGLSVAHAKGVFHRDIKPANMLVMQDGSLKILDFGVARLANSTMTASGFIVGTPDYMSPEQAQGLEVDARSDIFSAAGVFYVILTGRKPFEAPDLPAVLNRVMREDPLPLRETEAPEPLARILMKAFAKDPARRYQNCNDLFADLGRFKRHFESETRRMTTTACERYQAAMRFIAEGRTLQAALSTSTATLEADAATLQTRYPMFAQPDNDLRVGSFQRARIEEVLADLQSHHDRIAGEVSAMRAARAALDSAERAMAGGDLRLALQHYESCLRALPDCAPARAGIEPCRRLIAERQALEDRCRSLLGEARLAADAADWASTESLCDQVLAIDTAHVEASTLRDRARSMIAREAEQRARQFQQLCEHALGAADKRRFGDCEEFLRQAREIDPSSETLPAIEVRLADARAAAAAADALARRAAEEISHARASFEAGMQETAIASLRIFLDANPGAPGVEQEMNRLSAEAARQGEAERRRAEAAGLAAQAQAALAQGNAAEAARLAEAALAIDRTDQLAQQIHQGRARLRELAEIEARERTVATHVAKARELIGRSKFQKAVQEAERALVVDPASATAAQVIAEARRLEEKARADEESQKLAQQRARAAEASLKTARRALRARDFARATWAAENALAADPGHAEAQQLLQQARAGQVETDAARKAKEDETVDLSPGSGQTAGLSRAGAPLRSVLDSVGGWASTMLKRMNSSRGQTTTEWLMIAGVLSAVSIFILGIVPGALNQFVRSLAAGIRTVAP